MWQQTPQASLCACQRACTLLALSGTVTQPHLPALSLDTCRDAWRALRRRLLTPLAAQRALALILPTMPAEDAGELLLAKRFLASVALT